MPFRAMPKSVLRRARSFPLVLALSVAGLCGVSPTFGASSSFDLVGPNVVVTVKHGDITLPLESVPNLVEGDVVSIKLDLPANQTEGFRIVAGFLRGAIDRPSKDWFHEARSWKGKGADFSLTVPKGAQQMALLVIPESGGGANAVISTVRKRPGAFVRAVQELNQATLDRARLDAFLRETLKVERENPESVSAASQNLTRSLSIKLKAECLQQPAELQAACLTGDRETLLLADTHSSQLASTLAGAPTDLAFQLSATPAGGYGSYSSYIGVVRDMFRLLGAFQSTQLQFIPALSQISNGRTTLLLNTPLSFSKPTSVMVVAMPAVEAAKPPPLRASTPDIALCASPGMTLPVEGAPLIYATQYAREMALRLKRPDGTLVDVPIHADARRGGYVLDKAIPEGPFGGAIPAQIHGLWGFTPFDGPTFALSNPQQNNWKTADGTSLVVGRANDVQVLGGGAGCVTQVSLRRGDGAAKPVTWKQAGTRGIVATLPLDKMAPGPVSIVIEGASGTTPAVVTLAALQEAGSVDDLIFHAGDTEAILTGARLDQVKGMTLGQLSFHPGGLTRVDNQDRLTLLADDPTKAQTIGAGTSLSAEVAFSGGRKKTVPVTIAGRRTGATLVHIAGQVPTHEGMVPVVMRSDDVFAQDARISFAFHKDAMETLDGQESIEIATADARASGIIKAGKGYDLQDASTGIVAFSPIEALGPLAYGPVRFRVIEGDGASNWTSLATIVRLPDVRSVSCPARDKCQIAGDRLFLVKAAGASEQPDAMQQIPDGFVAPKITTTASRDGRIFLQLRDAPQAFATVATSSR